MTEDNDSIRGSIFLYGEGDMTSILDRHGQFTAESAVYPARGSGDITELMYLGLGLTGEAGEVADKIKKLFRDYDIACVEDIPRNAMQALVSELGDVLWYWSRLVQALELEPDGVVVSNMDKLTRRKARETIHGEGDDR